MSISWQNKSIFVYATKELYFLVLHCVVSLAGFSRLTQIEQKHLSQERTYSALKKQGLRKARPIKDTFISTDICPINFMGMRGERELRGNDTVMTPPPHTQKSTAPRTRLPDWLKRPWHSEALSRFENG